MQIVIDMPEKEYNLIKSGNGQDILKVRNNSITADRTYICRLENFIANGTPLPKGHGRLVDADKVLEAMNTWDKFGYSNRHGMLRLTEKDDRIAYVYYEDMVNCVSNTPTVIKADKECME